jgi:hypothetical protein
MADSDSLHDLSVNAYAVSHITGTTRCLAFQAGSACGSVVRCDRMYAVFPRRARKNRIPLKIKYLAAAGLRTIIAFAAIDTHKQPDTALP